jgi:SAM-dependent methyltransferase
MSEIIAGAAYVEAITALESDRRVRGAFQDLVMRIAPPGAALFDFGAGPGLDARLYAERGFSVAAYDIDPRMREFFRVYCREFMAAGKVVLYEGDYREFIAATPTERPADLITANFAPLNLVQDLHELFAKFHTLTGPDGHVLASVLSPYWLRDLKCSWWWRNVVRLWRAGYYRTPGPLAPVVRRRLTSYATESAPYFVLERVFRGAPAGRSADSGGIDLRGGGRHACWQLMGCQFMFLLFRRPNPPPA